jgi:DNA-directed RNA polymerase subunit M/transcription elongation factor TFIIS
MPITIACPNCDARLEAPDDIEGRKVQCKKCGETFRARPVEEDEDDRPARRAAKSAGKSRPRPAADDEDEDERPSRRTGKASRGRDEDDADDRDADEGRPRRRSRDEGDEEDGPRPRKKKRKKKKRAVSPVVLLILIGVGVLLLIAGMGAYISLSGDKSDGGAAAGGPVSGPGGGPGAGGESASDSAVPGWLEFDDPNGQFKVRLPRKPAAAAKQQWPLPNGDQGEATIYTVEIGGALWAVAYLNMPGREPGAPADPVLDDLITGGMGWFKGAVVKSKTNITHQGFPGRQAVLEYPGVKGTTVLRVILAGNRLFWALAKGDNFAADTPKVRGFFDSLKIN